MTCKDCMHREACEHIGGFLFKVARELEDVEVLCSCFSGRSGWLRLPKMLGSLVYAISEPCGGCKYANEPMREEFIELCRKCEKREVIEMRLDYELIPEWGKTVFATREEAEAAMKGANSGNETEE